MKTGIGKVKSLTNNLDENKDFDLPSNLEYQENKPLPRLVSNFGKFKLFGKPTKRVIGNNIKIVDGIFTSDKIPMSVDGKNGGLLYFGTFSTQLIGDELESLKGFNFIKGVDLKTEIVSIKDMKDSDKNIINDFFLKDSKIFVLNNQSHEILTINDLINSRIFDDEKDKILAKDVLKFYGKIFNTKIENLEHSKKLYIEKFGSSDLKNSEEWNENYFPEYKRFFFEKRNEFLYFYEQIKPLISGTSSFRNIYNIKELFENNTLNVDVDIMLKIRDKIVSSI